MPARRCVRVPGRTAERSRAIAFQTVTGPVRLRGRYRLDAAHGRTRVRFELEADVKGLKRLIAPMVQKTMDNEVRQLDSLKRVIETRSSGSHSTSDGAIE